MPGTTGYLFTIGPERVVHRCETLTQEEAGELLATFRSIIESPPLD
jgi:hypothetical protein